MLKQLKLAFRGRPEPPIHALCAWLIAAALPAASGALAQRATVQEQFVHYFSDGLSDISDIAGGTFDANGDAWLIARDDRGGIRKVSYDESGWKSDQFVFATEMDIYYRSTDVVGGVSDPELNASTFSGTPANFLLNPAPLTIDVPQADAQGQPTGTTESVTFQPGELAFFTDAQGLLAPVGGGQLYESTKRLSRYDLRHTQTAATSQPDFGNFVFGGQQAGFVGNVDWNDVFTQVISEQDLRDAAGTTSGSDNFGRSFAWSSDGQSIYAVDAGSNSGGIFRIDATTEGVVTQLRSDITSASDPDRGLTVLTRILSEPAVIHTSKLDLDPTNRSVGDQIVVTGSGDGGNQGGVNVYLDTGGSGPLPDPYPLFTEQFFRETTDYYGFTPPNFSSLEFDDAGNLYLFESRTNGLYVYDTEGRLASLATEREHAAFQEANGESANQNFLDLQTRVSTLPGFDVTEVVYTDDGLESIAGVLAYKVGDFDRDNDRDADDLTLFAEKLTTRNAPAADEDSRFDISGPAVIELTEIVDSDPVEFEYRNVRRGEAVVDWKDVKILQGFFDIPNGDTNFDSALDFTDLDTMNANYYTESGQTEETWATGDFASIDPRYLYDAPDANLVNEIDLAVLADAWLNDLNQPAPTEGELIARGYSGQFLVDVLAAFLLSPAIDGDYDDDGDVDRDDYEVWSASLGSTGSGLPADGNEDGVVNAADYVFWRENALVTPAGDFNGDGVVDAVDYLVWRESEGQTGADLAADGNADGAVDELDYRLWVETYLGSFASPVALTVPEPSTPCLLAIAALARRRESR